VHWVFVLALMGLYPGLTGVEPTVGIGIVQVFMLLSGYALLLFGAIVYVRFTFYWRAEINLAQQIGLRLVLRACSLVRWRAYPIF
jgi:multisubunit Na+/H+ antiporter MnhG subunit